ncbi:MAG: alpha/beta hydrolase [Bacteroidota bacterium]
MPTINYYQHKISYDIKGRGTPIVFLHGFGENRQMWREFTQEFEENTLITIDLPGSGESDAMDVSIARMAKVVRAVLLAERIDKCLLIGHSMGGYVALAFAKLYPELLLGYCLFHSQPNADTEEKKTARNKGISFVKRYGNALYFKGLVPQLFGQKYRKDNAHTIDKTIFYGSQMPAEGVVYQLAAMRDRPDNRAVLKNSKAPVCFIIGNQDVAIPTENSEQQTYLPNVADIHFLPDKGHMGMYEAPKKTRQILLNFLEFCQEMA